MPDTDTANTAPRGALPPVAAILVIALCAANLRTMLGVIAAASATIEAELGGSGVLVGALSTGMVLLVAVGSTVVLVVNRRVGPRAAVSISLLLTALALVILSIPATPMLWVAIVPGGLGAGMLGALVPWQVRELAPGSTGAGIGAMMAGSSLGLLASTLLAGWAASALGTWRLAALLFCGLAVVSLCAWLLAARRRGIDRPTSLAAPTDPGGEKRVGIRAVLALPWLVPLILFAGLQAAAAFALLAWLGPSAIHAGWDPSQVGMLLAIFSTVQVAGGVLAPFWAQRTVAPGRPVIVASAILLAGSVGMVPLFGWVDSAGSPWAFACLTVVAIGHGSTFALANYIVAARSATAGEAVAAGAILLFLSQLLGAAGPVGFGILRDLTGGFTLPFIACAAVSVVIVGVSPSLWRRERRGRHDAAGPRVQERKPEANPH